MRMKAVLLLVVGLLAISVVVSAEVAENFIVEPIFNTKVRILEAGNRRHSTLLLIHGVGPEGAEIWSELIPELAQQYHVVACDLPGFGQSDKPNRLYSPENYSAFLAWLVEQKVDDRFILAGHSLGGALALHYAATAQQKPDKLILIDAAGILHRAALTKFLVQMQLTDVSQYVPASPLGWFDRVVGAAIEKLQNAPIDLDLLLRSELLREQILQGDSVKIAGLALVQTDYTELIEQVTTPTFLLWGEGDEIAPLRTGQMLAARLPHAQLDLLADGGHTPMRRQPTAFRQAFYRALQTTPVKLPGKVASNSQRIGRCNGENNISFRGNYQRIELNQCSNVSLVDVDTQELVVADSEVTLDRTSIRGQGVGIDALRAQITATAVDIEADLPIRTNQSRFDFVGAQLRSRTEQLIAGAGNPSRLLFSVSRGVTVVRNESLHGVISVTAEQGF